MKSLRVCLLILSLLLLIAEVCRSALNLELIATMTGENEGDRFGRTVAELGDINGDDSNDVAVGASCYDNYTGKVYIYLGSGTFDNNADLLLYGETPGSGFGSVSSAGDVNGDGYSDFIVGASGYNSQRGKAYLYFGGVSLDTIPDLTFEEPVGEYGAFGAEVSCAGDVNNDGFGDIIISATNEGKVYLYLGGEYMDTIADAIFSEGDGFGGSVSSAGDVNGDGYDDIIVGSTYHSYLFLGGEQIDTTADLVFSEGQEVTSGDFNADGFSDVFTSFGGIYFGGINMDAIVDVHIVLGNGASGYFNKGVYCDLLVGNGSSFGGLGSAWVLLGGNPLDSIPDWGVAGEYDGHLGFSVSSAGDVNGDSVEDVIIGEPDYFFGSGRGRAYVYKGDTLYNGVEYWNQPYRLPREFELYQNYPNPFNSSTVIRYSLLVARPCPTILKVYNILGEEVRSLVNTKQKEGKYEVIWDGRDEEGEEVGSGIYFYLMRMETREGGMAQKTRKLLLIR